LGKSGGEEKVIRATDAKEVGVENPAEETFCYPNRILCRKHALTCQAAFPVFFVAINSQRIHHVRQIQNSTARTKDWSTTRHRISHDRARLNRCQISFRHFRVPCSERIRFGGRMTEYKVKFEVFEGPLDLLLYLIKKEEVDIYEVNLTQLATQFIEYIEVMRLLDLDIAGEFLVMASTLMYIKSRELLPVDQQVTPEGEEEGEDPRWELIRQLVEYKKFKDAAAQLQTLEVRQEEVYPHLPPRPDFGPDESQTRGQASLFDLINAVNAVLKRINSREDLRDIFEDKWTVSEKIETILKEITTSRSLKFSALFASATSRTEVVVTFLAMLELIRLKQIVAIQESPFSEIELSQAPLAVADENPATAYAEAVTQDAIASGTPPDASPATTTESAPAN